MDQGKVIILIAIVYPLAQVSEAFQALEKRQSIARSRWCRNKKKPPKGWWLAEELRW